MIGNMSIMQAVSDAMDQLKKNNYGYEGPWLIPHYIYDDWKKRGYNLEGCVRDNVGEKKLK